MACMHYLPGHATRAAVALAVTLAVATAVAQQPDQPAFRTGVDLVSLNVTVTDGDNRYVTDIEQASFQLYEDGALQDITFFTRTQLPIALALLMDTSASMTEKMSTAQQAAIGFAERLRDEDQASVIDFDSRVDILQGFTNSIDELKAAIRRTSAGGSTSLYNAIYISLKELGKVGATTVDEIRRQAIVMLSDGEDTSSLVEFDEVLDLAKAVRHRHLLDRAAVAGHPHATRVPRGRLRAATARPGDRGPGPSFPSRRRISLRSINASRMSSPVSTRWGTSRRTRCRTAGGVASSCGSTVPTSPPGQSRATTRRPSGEGDGSAAARPIRGPVKNRFAFLGVEAPGWQGARREHTSSIRPTRNAARRDGSAARNVKLFLTGPKVDR